MKRALAMAAAVATIAVASALPANAETSGQYGVARNGKICIQNHGWNFYAGILTGSTGLAARMTAQGVANVVTDDDCAGFDAVHTVKVTTINTTEQFCARTFRGENGAWAKEGGRWVWGARVEINVGIPSCYNSTFAKAHVISHEVMHAFGMIHEGRYDRVVDGETGWDYQWPTNQDYRDLRAAGYVDVL